MASKKGTMLPKAGTFVPEGKTVRERAGYKAMISASLRAELGRTPHATKTVMHWTGASERTVKNWFAAIKGPSGEHLVELVRRSDWIFTGLLALSARDQATADRLVHVRARLIELVELIDGLARIET